MHQAVRRPRLVLAVVAASAFSLSVDLTFVNVALPDIGRRFQAERHGYKCPPPSDNSLNTPGKSPVLHQLSLRNGRYSCGLPSSDRCDSATK